jgi:hypothetical protein
MGHGYGGITNNFIFYFLFIYTVTHWVIYSLAPRSITV